MLPTYEVFEAALTLFHRTSVQNEELERQLRLRGILPEVPRAGFSVLDLGAGQGRLPRLLAPWADPLILVEPNPRCVELLRGEFPHVSPNRWGEPARDEVRREHPGGFSLVTMSHMLYHLGGLDDIRAKLALALGLLEPGGHLVVVINQEPAPMARLGMRYLLARGSMEAWSTNRVLHDHCHEARFYREVAGEGFDVEVRPVDGSLYGVASRDELIRLFRMPLLDPLSKKPCDTDALDAFLAEALDAQFPGLAYPATIPSLDDLVVIRRSAAGSAAPSG